MKQSYVPVQDHVPSLHSETIDPLLTVLSKTTVIVHSLWGLEAARCKFFFVFFSCFALFVI